MTLPGNLQRPLSPSGGAVPTTLMPINGKGRPSVLYYILLVVLIALSIFALRLYQKRAESTVVPDLSVPIAQPTTGDSAPEQIAENNSEYMAGPFFLDAEPVTVGPEPVETVTVEPAIVEPPLPSDTQTASNTPADDAPLNFGEPQSAVPYFDDAPTQEEAAQIPSQENDNDDASLNFGEPQSAVPYFDDAPTQEEATQIPSQENDVAPICEDGSAPDIDGCCTGEAYIDMGGGQGAGCCNMETGDCFPPLF